MFGYSFIKKPSFHFSTDTVDKIFKNISDTLLHSQNGTLNIVFVSEEEIKELNKNYRKKNNVTDVLSFHYYEDFSQLKNTDIAGELVFCEEKIILQGKEYGLGEEKEFYKLLIHSVLHIIGFDHEDDSEYEEMKKWEEMIWKNIFTV